MKSRFYFLLALLPLAILLVLFILPLSFNLSKAFFNEEGFTLDLVRDVFTAPYTYRLLAFTLLQAFISGFVSVLIALPGAYLYANYRFRTKNLMLSLSSLCFVLPSILVVLGFVIFYGNSGFVNELYRKITGSSESIKILYSFKAIILAHAFLNIPVALSLITDSWSNMSRNTENAARTLGAGNIRIFFSITLTRLLPSILSAFLLIFLFCFTSFSIILVLGGGPEYTTLEVEIYRTNNIVLDSARASALSIFTFIVNLAILIIYTFISRTAENRDKSREDRAVPVKSWKIRCALLIYNTLMLIFILGPIVSIIARSFVSTSKRYGEGFSLRSYQEIFGTISSIGAMGDAYTALLNSIFIGLAVAAAATVLALFLSLYSSKKNSRLLEITGMFPLAISSVTLGLGYYIIKAHIQSDSIIVSYMLVILAHLVIALPFAMRTLSPAVRSGNRRILLAAYTLGTSEARTCFGIEIPMLKSSLAKAFIFSFALSVGEVNATLTLAEGRVITLPILLYRLINSYNYQGACAIGTILILTTFIIFSISEKLGRRKHNEQT